LTNSKIVANMFRMMRLLLLTAALILQSLFQAEAQARVAYTGGESGRVIVGESMSQLLINQYQNELDRYKKISGSDTEGVISEAFKDLLKAWSRQNNLTFINQYEFVSTKGNRIRPDGTILHDLRVPLGYWEAKDTNDNLDDEIAKKQAKGYPLDNIIYEDSHTAVLIQNKNEVMRCEMLDTAALLKLVTLFFRYERQEISDFRKAVEQFKIDIPAVLDALREKIDEAYNKNAAFKAAAAKFLAHAKNTINPIVSEADVREMLIQHILTEEIFAHVFDQGDFHRENNIAKELYALEAKFFTGQVKRETLKSLETYYATIRSNAALITSHAEKQTFLKVIYENFYKVYNPKAADRLGVVYTPNEIVKFMIEGADWLTQKHFGKSLIDRDVEILDPATGTGTFICELLEHFRGQPQKLAHKYKHELHANEVAILPYYVANLNIEATYAAISGQFAEFPNLCFVDTLDNIGGLGVRSGTQLDMLAGLSDENIERVKRQNKCKISVIIGNPPYNANQANENDNNKNREYAHIDKLIKATYIKQSTAQKTKLYDMYARFFRWASDRMNDDGVLAFITNRSFIASRTFDGFRKVVAEEFNEIYVMDLGGDVRANPKLSGTKHNVFGIQTGVAISFFVKRHKQNGCKIFYARRPEMETAEDKVAFLGSIMLSEIEFERVKPDKNANWVNLSANDWDNSLALADKATKASKKKGQERAICRLFSLGVSTNRDDWIFDVSERNLNEKMKFFVNRYQESARVGSALSEEIKLSRNLKRRLQSGRKEAYDVGKIAHSIYGPFVRKYFYRSDLFIDETGSLSEIAPLNVEQSNEVLMICGHPQIPFTVHTVSGIPDAGYASRATQTFPRFTFAEDGERIDNITDWGLKQFQAHYKKQKISKDDIFHYVYGVLHDPVYREKYAINLKREFPRIPFYPDFKACADWGARLMALHIGYETVKPWDLQRVDTATGDAAPKPVLKADKDNGSIRLDSATVLTGIPASAWEYRLGNRSGLEWILDQYKEKKPKDPTIREKFNTYRFADYKEKVIDLLARVTRVSVETMEIVEAMKKEQRSG
jgi:predicted helicase